MTSLIYKTVKERGFSGSIDTLLDKLSNIRLGTILENTGKKGKPKAVYKLEEMETYEKALSLLLALARSSL